MLRLHLSAEQREARNSEGGETPLFFVLRDAPLGPGFDEIERTT